MIYGDTPNKINEREDALGLKAYTYTPSISSIMQSGNLYVYCGNNPISRTDPTGNEWWHWALGATVVVGCAVATVVTCGGFAAAATAVCMVGSGVAATTTASTVAAGAFIGSSMAYGFTVLSAAGTSDSVDEFNEQGNWGTVAVTAGGAIIGGIVAKPSVNTSNTVQPKTKEIIKNDIIDLPRKGHALKSDPYHAFPDIVDNYAGYAVQTPINNGTLYQLSGSLNGKVGRFEWIIQDNYVTHRLFVKGGDIIGFPIIKQYIEKY